MPGTAEGVGEFGGEQCVVMHICQCTRVVLFPVDYPQYSQQSGVSILRSAPCWNSLAAATARSPESAGSTRAALRDPVSWSERGALGVQSPRQFCLLCFQVAPVQQVCQRPRKGGRTAACGRSERLLGPSHGPFLLGKAGALECFVLCLVDFILFLKLPFYGYNLQT